MSDLILLTIGVAAITVNGERIGGTFTQEKTCLSRTIEQACPFNHEIQGCKANNTMDECVPCNMAAGYRNCIKVYSQIAEIKCYRPSLGCHPTEVANITDYPDGSCQSNCICNAREGFVFNGSECVLIGTICGINSTIIDGKCTGCPHGKYKPQEGYMDCEPVPDKTPIVSSKSGTTELPLGTTDSDTDTNGGPTDKTAKPGPSVEESKTNLAIVIPTVVIPIVIIVIIIGVCIWKKRQGTVLTRNMCNGGIRRFFERISCCISPTRVSDPGKDVELGEGNMNEHDEDAMEDSRTLHPSSRTEDIQHPNGSISQNGEAHHVSEETNTAQVPNGDVHIVPNPDKEILPPIPVPTDESTETEPFLPNDQETTCITNGMSSSAQFKSFPTLMTNGKSSLPINHQFSDPDNTRRVTTPTHDAVSMKQGEDTKSQGDGMGELPQNGAGELPYHFGSSFSVISESDNEILQ